MKLEEIELKPGDIFLTRNPMWLGRLINFVQKFWSQDDNSKYSHAGIIMSKYGDTFESLWTIKASNLKEYKNKEIIILRFKNMSARRFRNGMNAVFEHKGQLYPFHKLTLMLIPPLGKKINFGSVVCSELTAKFIKFSGWDIYWKGMSPDGLDDFTKNHRDCDIVFKGVFE